MTHLHAAAALYGTSEDSLEQLGAFESDVYAFEGLHGPSILKVITPEHRSVAQVHAEVDWLLALLEAGVPVAEPLRAVTGEWVERLDDPERVLVAFRRSPGVVTKPADWTEARVESWGELLGRLQAHSRPWTPPGERRPQLIDDNVLTRIDELAPDDAAFARAAKALAREATPLLSDGPGSGLIHADLHQGNLILNGENWTAIDFDDCAYGSYAFDLAMPLYYAVRAQRDVPAEEAAARFLGPFMRGFRRHAPDPAGGAEAVALSLSVRQAELVLALRENLGDGEWDERWQRMEMELRENATHGRNVVELQVLRRWLE